MSGFVRRTMAAVECLQIGNAAAQCWPVVFAAEQVGLDSFSVAKFRSKALLSGHLL